MRRSGRLEEHSDFDLPLQTYDFATQYSIRFPSCRHSATLNARSTKRRLVT